MAEKTNYTFALLAMVAIVAIVAIVVMFMNRGTTKPEVQEAMPTSGFTQEETSALEEIANNIGEENLAGNFPRPYYTCDQWEIIIDKGCDNVGTFSEECMRAIFGFERVCRGLVMRR